MISVIIATDGKEQPAVATLSSLVTGAASGLIREVLLVDRAASATIARVADVAGCAYFAAPVARGEALAKGAAQARGPWLMFMHAGTVLDPSWTDEAAQFIQNVALSGRPRAGIFRFARSPYSEAGLRERLRGLARLLGRPSPEQGLLIARDHYERLGGYRAEAQRPEAGLLCRLGRARMTLRSRAVVL